MKKGSIFYLVIASVLFIFPACENLIFEDNPSSTPRDNFEYLWKQANERYSFFEYKGINWDEVYSRYSRRVRNNINDVELFNILWEMLNELQDGHVNLYSPFNISRFEFQLTAPENYNARLVRDHYLGDDFFLSGAFSHNFIRSRKQDVQTGPRDIAYVRYGSFSRTVGGTDIGVILGRYRNTKGMILDLRSNGGGSVLNIFRMLNYFTDRKIRIYDSYIKNGPGSNDFEGPQSAFAEPQQEGLWYDKPIIVLVNRSSFSATSFFSLGARALPGMTLMGDTTGGGLGAPNGGQLPNGWTYRFSVTQTISHDGFNFENGVPPDIVVYMTKDDQNNGIDTMIERAIVKIINGS